MNNTSLNPAGRHKRQRRRGPRLAGVALVLAGVGAVGYWQLSRHLVPRELVREIQAGGTSRTRISASPNIWKVAMVP